MTSIGYSHPARRSDLQRTAILLLAILQVLVTLLPSLGLGEPIGERSDAVRTAITPAGWAFSIWGLLYAGSLAYAIYQFLPAQRTNALLARIGWASAGAFLGNALWALYTQFVDLKRAFGSDHHGHVVVPARLLSALCHLAATVDAGRAVSRRAAAERPCRPG